MIKDSLQFRRYIDAWFSTFDRLLGFNNVMYGADGYDYDKPGLTVPEREKRFLQALNSYPALKPGLRLFRGNDDMTAFTPIKLNSAQAVRPSPCD